MHVKFSYTGPKEKLLNTFPEHVPDTKEFDMDYYEQPENQ